MIKTFLYTLSYNNESDVETWLDCYKDVDYILVVDLGSTDNTIDLLSKDPRVYTRIPGLECSYIEALDYTLSLAKDFAKKLTKENEEYILLNFNFNELLRTNGIQEIKEQWQNGNYTQASVIQHYLINTPFKTEAIKICSLDSESTWTYTTGAFQLGKENNTLLQTGLNLICSEPFDFFSLESDPVRIRSLFKNELTIKDTLFLRKLILHCKKTLSYDLFDYFYPRIFQLYLSFKDSLFKVDDVLSLYLMYILLLTVGSDFYPEFYSCDYNHLYAVMHEFYVKFNNLNFLFKKFSYECALLLIEKETKEELSEVEKTRRLKLLQEALETDSNILFSEEFPDLDSSYNVIIQELIDKYSK